MRTRPINVSNHATSRRKTHRAVANGDRWLPQRTWSPVCNRPLHQNAIPRRHRKQALRFSALGRVTATYKDYLSIECSKRNNYKYLRLRQPGVKLITTSSLSVAICRG
ncbi:hypothetical protein EVAR_32224_1 [Eumeta japonica]|uniref:Uncharacterized protein n=1 Tax=Eumeta variegata TaxID=151549 RepID=A0A4C1YLM0_EUMVA|nr:hypothetical protein EVAR_32224_1 [Eumeta japonica]